jgi:hypothetical protein
LANSTRVLHAKASLMTVFDEEMMLLHSGEEQRIVISFCEVERACTRKETQNSAVIRDWITNVCGTSVAANLVRRPY